MPAEFDQYAAQYRALLRDPIREKFAPGSQFFMQRKWELLESFLRRRGVRPGPWNPATQMIVRRTPVDADACLLRISESGALLASAEFSVIGREFFLYLPESLYRKAGALERCLKGIPFGGQYAVFGEKRI